MSPRASYREGTRAQTRQGRAKVTAPPGTSWARGLHPLPQAKPSLFLSPSPCLWVSLPLFLLLPSPPPLLSLSLSLTHIHTGTCAYTHTHTHTHTRARTRVHAAVTWTRTTRLPLSHHLVSGQICTQRAEQSGPSGPHHVPPAIRPSNPRCLKWALGKHGVTVASWAPCWAPGVPLFSVVD